MPNNAIGVQILGDPTSLIRAFKKSEVAATQFAGRMTAVNQASRGALAGSGFNKGALLFGSTTFVAAAVGAATIQKAVTAASDLNEQITKNNAVFKQSAATIQDWSKTTAESIGVSREAALEATGTFGNLFHTVGLAPEASADMSRALVKLAADLASFNNANIDDVFVALKSGLVGEAEPLRKFGVLLSETRVQQQALADTGKENVKSLTAQEKALARYELILRDTAPAQGDFERTSGGLANQTRILKANLDDLSAELGSILLPAMVNIVGAGNNLLHIFGDLQKIAGKFGGAFDDSSKGAGGFGKELTRLLTPGASLKAVTGTLADALDKLAGKSDKATESLSAIDPMARGIRERILDMQKAADSVDFSNIATEVAGLEISLLKIQTGLSGGSEQENLRKQIEADKRAVAVSKSGTRARREALQELKADQEELARLISNAADDAAARAEKVKQAALEREQEAQQAYQAAIDALSLRLDIASTTRTFKDDIAALRAIEDQIRARIAEEGETTDLARQLFENRKQQADIARQARNAEQFEKLGLTSTGDKITPSVAALKKRLGSIREAVKGTTLDTAKTRNELASIAKVLSGAFGDVGKDVRDAILQMFNDISDALDNKNNNIHELTKTTSLNTRKLLEGLDLTPEQERRLRARLSNFNSGGTSLANAQSVGETGGQFVVEVNTDVNLDGQKVASNTTKHQQKSKRRNPQQKRGPHRKN